jgi:gliding motility-associated-like protein
MSRRIIFTICILILILTNRSLLAQSTFQKNIPVFIEKPLVRSAPDGQSVYVAGRRRANGQVKIHILRLSGNGTLLWYRTYETNDENFELNAIVPLSDGLAVTMSKSNLSVEIDAFVSKFKDSDGSKMWSKQIGDKSYTKLFDMEKDDEDNLWLSGMHLKKAPSDSTYYFYMKMKSDGAVLGNKQNLFRYFSNPSPYEGCKYESLTWNKSAKTMIMVENFEVPGAQSGIALTRGNASLGFCDKNFNYDEYLLGVAFSKIVATANNVIFSGYSSPWGTTQAFSKDTTVIGILDNQGKNHLKTLKTDGFFQPIHSNNGEIMFFSPKDRALIKYDNTLKAIWSKRLDNCVETDGLSADIAVDGTIYSARSIGNKTIVSRMLSNGSMAICNSYTVKTQTLKPASATLSTTYSPYGYPNFPLTTKDSTLVFLPQVGVVTDFCTRLDASFELPDTICLGEVLVPKKVDTSKTLTHFWRYENLDFTTINPSFTPTKPGLKKILHSVQNNVCSDTFAHYVYVLPFPTITLNDTIVCGAPTLTFNLSNPLVSGYFLDNQPVNPKLNITKSGIYAIRLESGKCKTAKTVKVKIVDFPKPILPPDSTYCYGTAFKAALGKNFENIFWDKKPFNDTLLIRDSGKHFYQATYSLDKDCMVKGDIQVTFKKCGDLPEGIYVPNIFSPNGDTNNDFFQAFPIKEITIRALLIYDRWGNLIYQTSEAPFRWNGEIFGKAAQQSVYTYRLDYYDLRTDSDKVKRGDVMLIR